MTAGSSSDARTKRLAMAEAAVAALKDDYVAQMQLDVQELSRIWSETDQLNFDFDSAEELFAIAHNLKGQAGTFGYELVTLVASSLCDRLRDDQPGVVKTNAKAAGRHIQVLAQIVAKNIVGTGGEMGAQIVQALHALPKGS